MKRLRNLYDVLGVKMMEEGRKGRKQGKREGGKRLGGERINVQSPFRKVQKGTSLVVQ